MSKKHKHNIGREDAPAPEDMQKLRADEQRQADIEHANLLRAYKAVMDTDEGVTVLRHVLAYTNYRSSPWDKHAGVMAHSVGKMEVGNFITSHMAQADTELYCKLMIFNQDSSDQQGGSV